MLWPWQPLFWNRTIEITQSFWIEACGLVTCLIASNMLGARASWKLVSLPKRKQDVGPVAATSIREYTLTTSHGLGCSRYIAAMLHPQRQFHFDSLRRQHQLDPHSAFGWAPCIQPLPSQGLAFVSIQSNNTRKLFKCRLEQQKHITDSRQAFIFCKLQVLRAWHLSACKVFNY